MQQTLDIDAVHKLIGKAKGRLRRPVPDKPIASKYPPGSFLEYELIPIELTNDNEGRGGSFRTSAKRRKLYEKTLIAEGMQGIPYDHAVSIVLTRILGPGQREWDADSVLRGSAKELLDALVSVGWFHDDSPKWIKTMDGRQISNQRALGPSVRIDVFSA